MFGFSGILLGFMFGVLSLWGWDNVGLVPFKTCPLLGKLFVVQFFFFSLVVWLISSSSLSLFLSLSLSGAGETQTPLGFGFPLVFSASWTSTTSSTRSPCSASSPRSSPAPVFFFFASPSIVGLLVGKVAVGCVLVKVFCF